MRCWEIEMDSAAGDLIFKLIFGNEKSKTMLVHLLNSVIDPRNRSIKNVTVRKTELTPEYVGGKEVRLDVLAETSDHRIVNVEIQRRKRENFRKRSLFHWSELYFQQLPKGGDFIDLHQTVCINILEESLFKDTRFWHTYHMREDETHELLTDDEEIHFIEIKKMKKFREDSPITWWCEFIKNPHSEVVKKIGEFEPTIKEAVKMFDYVTSDPQMRELIRIREAGLRDYNSDIGSAERRGEAKKALETAQKMLGKGVDLADISEFTGLSIEDIKSLKAD
jgi:predicted transposase/invertase (TIGR01784 family)